jgi:hypothetical protein
LLGVEVGQDAVFRGLLLERLGETVPPYRNITVVEFTDRVSPLSNRLGRCRVKDKGLTVPRELGAICTNVLSTDWDSLSYPRTPAELLRILYLGYLGSSRIVKKELEERGTHYIRAECRSFVIFLPVLLHEQSVIVFLLELYSLDRWI